MKLAPQTIVRGILECAATAALYVVLARLGQVFAIPPGNITPVWLPSGIMLALVALRGEHLLIGVFFGAMAGNAWAYIDMSSFSAMLPGLGAAGLNGIGDVACVAIGLIPLRDRQLRRIVFRRLGAFSRFLIFSVALGPLVSAVMGVSGLAATGHIEGSVLNAGYVWWMGDAVGVLALTPLILSYASPSTQAPHGTAERPERWLLGLGLLMLPLLTSAPMQLMGNTLDGTYLVVPILLWAMIRVGLQSALWGVLYLITVQLSLGVLVDQDVMVLQLRSPAELQFFIAVVVTSLLVAGTLIHEQVANLNTVSAEASHDPLTGLYNRRGFDEALRKELSRQTRTGLPLSLLMFDIDHFKQVNDRLGHDTGDRVLVSLAAAAKSELRVHDTLARWGGRGIHAATARHRSGRRTHPG